MYENTEGPYPPLLTPMHRYESNYLYNVPYTYYMVRLAPVV